MKTNLVTGLKGMLLIALMIAPGSGYAQKEARNHDAAIMGRYLEDLPGVSGNPKNGIQKYRMTAVYTNRDLYGNFTGKTKVVGEYTRGLENGYVVWNNIYISDANSFQDSFPIGSKQEYMENMKYIPSAKMIDSESFKDFPPDPRSVFSRNLIWDMMAIEGFAWNYTDSLKLNRVYRIPDIKGEFTMADIGTYSHTEIQICWTGFSSFNDELCAVIEYRALDNKIEMVMDGFKTKGTEQYWGTVFTSLQTGSIASAVMYGGTIQEIEIAGMKDKFLVKTIRELWLDKIQ